MSNKPRVAVAALTVSAAALLALLGEEGFRSKPYIPTQGDVPTIGYGSTAYEDGSKVTLADPPISKERALQIVRNHKSKDEALFRASLPGVKLTQGEYDLYMDFTYQFGISNWRSSSMRRYLLQGEYVQACNVLPAWRNQGGRDCSMPQNWGPKGCKGVWTRQLERHAKCLGEQS
ncbi:glycoside hydrolase family protein [Comamonas odontotermitis]|uniref:glycoside hydrolase family protein n=1 Tax=Comamonas odontotermitis TaxID=379895 RepID=UPI00366CC190